MHPLAADGLRRPQADVAVARAGVETAQIDLDYASVTAPIDGRIGRSIGDGMHRAVAIEQMMSGDLGGKETTVTFTAAVAEEVARRLGSQEVAS